MMHYNASNTRLASIGGTLPLNRSQTQYKSAFCQPNRLHQSSLICRSDVNDGESVTKAEESADLSPSNTNDNKPPPQQRDVVPRKGGGKREAESTDWVATQLTRRFGIFGGLAWVGVLAFGVISEQLKTREEQAAEEAGTKDVTAAKEVVTPEGLHYVDLRIGGGQYPPKGYLVILDYKGYANGELFEDTKARGRPIVFTYKSRPFTGGICKGVEMALETMKAGGVRKVTVPPELGFGESGMTLRPTRHEPEKQGVVPPGATLEYELSLLRISIPP